MARPTSFYYETPQGCGSQSCSQEILALGTPILWWLGTIAVIAVIGLWIRIIAVRRIDPALSLIVTGMAAGYLPWFFFQRRTVFSFYAIVFEPFLILALVYCARSIMSSYGKTGEIVVISLLVLIAVNFIYFLPLYVGDLITYDAWHARMWFTNWI
jgi:dolichyl-phosphate-mannose--protein O-mannosyl transferase